jgi:transposase
MKPYSLDLREKILRAYDGGSSSQRAVAALFGVSRSFIEKLLQRRRTVGRIAPLPHAGGRQPKLNDAALVRRLVKQQPDATLDELRERAEAAHGPAVSRATMSRWLRRWQLPRKKSRSTGLSETPRASGQRGRTTGNKSQDLTWSG